MVQSKMLTRLLSAAGMAVLALVLLAPLAQAKEPAPGYTQFAGCPSPEEVAAPAITGCVRSEVTGGHLQIGKKDVPIKTPLVLSGGVNDELENFTANSKGGLTKVKQEVPGGIIGLTGLDWLVNFLSLEGLKLYAVTELTGPPTGFTISTVTIPIKVHLENPVLGKNCYVGSTSSPITLKLTTGTTSPPPPNVPITGKEPTISFDEKEILHLDNGIYVDNAFSAPGASGCVLTLFGFIPISLNSFVNSQSGLPAAAGTNEAVQNFNVELVERVKVYP
jgi:hypothetical protein